MKKLLLCVSMLVISATSSFSADTITMVLDATNTGLTLYGDKTAASDATALIAKTSTGVGLGILVDTGGVGYSHVTQHIQGSKVFGTGFDSTAIFTKDVATIGTVEVGAPGSINTTDEFVGWTAM